MKEKTTNKSNNKDKTLKALVISNIVLTVLVLISIVIGGFSMYRGSQMWDAHIGMVADKMETGQNGALIFRRIWADIDNLQECINKQDTNCKKEKYVKPDLYKPPTFTVEGLKKDGYAKGYFDLFPAKHENE